MAEYGSMILVSALAAILFFGGWNGPIPVFSGLMDLFPNYLGNCWYFGTFANLFGVLNLLIKASIGVIAMMWVRWTFPRLRVDQVITMCLKYCVPIVAVCLIGVLFWTALGVPFFNDLLPAQDRSLVREGWVREAEKRAAKRIEQLEAAAKMSAEGEVE